MGDSHTGETLEAVWPKADAAAIQGVLHGFWRLERRMQAFMGQLQDVPDANHRPIGFPVAGLPLHIRAAHQESVCTTLCLSTYSRIRRILPPSSLKTKQYSFS